MKEKGMFFTEEQKQLLSEISELESSNLDKLKDQLTGSMPEVVFTDDRKKLTVSARMKIAEKIQSKYSLLKNQKGIFNEQIFSAFEDYLKECESTEYRYEGL